MPFCLWPLLQYKRRWPKDTINAEDSSDNQCNEAWIHDCEYDIEFDMIIW